MTFERTKVTFDMTNVTPDMTNVTFERTGIALAPLILCHPESAPSALRELTTVTINVCCEHAARRSLTFVRDDKRDVRHDKGDVRHDRDCVWIKLQKRRLNPVHPD